MLVSAATAAMAGACQDAQNHENAHKADSDNSSNTENGTPPKSGDNNCATVTTDDIRNCFGLGVAVGGFFFTEPDIVSTSIDGGAVRVLEEHQREASFWLEGHDTLYRPCWAGGISFGPFLGLQLGGTSGTLNSFAIGGMLYFPNQLIFGGSGSSGGGNANNPEDSSGLISGFGIGLGYGWTQIHRLGDGIVEDQPLPTGVSSVRLKQTDIGGLVIMLSTTVHI